MSNQIETGGVANSDTRENEAGNTEAEFHRSTDKLIRNAASTMLVIVIFASALMSWRGLVQLGEMAGMGWSSWLLPVAIDGTLLLGSLETLHAVLGKRKSKFGGILTLVGVTLSIAGNMISAASLGWLAASIHAIPPLMLFLSLAAFERIVKHRISVEKAVERKKQRKVQSRSAVKPLFDQPKQGQASAVKASKPTEKREDSDESASIELLKGVLANMDPDASKASKIEAMLLSYPDTRAGLLAAALEVPTKSVGTTISRVRKRLVEQGSAEVEQGASVGAPLYAVS